MKKIYIILIIAFAIVCIFNKSTYARVDIDEGTYRLITWTANYEKDGADTDPSLQYLKKNWGYNGDDVKEKMILHHSVTVKSINRGICTLVFNDEQSFEDNNLVTAIDPDVPLGIQVEDLSKFGCEIDPSEVEEGTTWNAKLIVRYISNGINDPTLLQWDANNASNWNAYMDLISIMGENEEIDEEENEEIDNSQYVSQHLSPPESGVAAKVDEILMSLVRLIADLMQMLANTIQSVPEGTAGRLTYTREKLEEDEKRNNYTNVGDYEDIEDNSHIKLTQKYFTEKTEIPVIQVDVYTLAAGYVGALDVNFLSPDTTVHEEGSFWWKIRDFISSFIHISYYLSAAFLISLLIWDGIQIVRGSITPEKRRSYKESLQLFAKSLGMLIGTIVIMALCIYSSKMFFDTIKKNTKSENQSETKYSFPLRVNVENAEYSFDASVTGYLRYMTESSKFVEKKTYIFLYLFIAEINLAAAILMIVRMMALWVLGIIGPIIAALHAVKLDRSFPLKYGDWIKWYIGFSSIQLLLALGYKIFVDMSI